MLTNSGVSFVDFRQGNNRCIESLKKKDIIFLLGNAKLDGNNGMGVGEVEVEIMGYKVGQLQP